MSPKTRPAPCLLLGTEACSDFDYGNAFREGLKLPVGNVTKVLKNQAGAAPGGLEGGLGHRGLDASLGQQRPFLAVSGVLTISLSQGLSHGTVASGRPRVEVGHNA